MTEWRPVVGYEGFYEVSEFGDVRSVDRCVVSRGRRKPLRGRPMRPFLSKAGYPRLNLCRDGETRGISIHRMVACAFILWPEGKTQVNHIDGNKRNNHVKNLEWVTGAENSHHRIDGGFSRHNKLKLTRSDVVSAREEYLSGVSVQTLSQKYGVSYEGMSHAISGISWKRVPGAIKQKSKVATVYVVECCKANGENVSEEYRSAKSLASAIVELTACGCVITSVKYGTDHRVRVGFVPVQPVVAYADEVVS